MVIRNNITGLYEKVTEYKETSLVAKSDDSKLQILMSDAGHGPKPVPFTSHRHNPLHTSHLNGEVCDSSSKYTTTTSCRACPATSASCSQHAGNEAAVQPFPVVFFFSSHKCWRNGPRSKSQLRNHLSTRKDIHL